MIKMKNLRKDCTNTILLLLIIFPALAFFPSKSHAFEKGVVSVSAATGKINIFSVEIATSAKDITHGLMFRKYLHEKQGMLFDFKYPKIARMWMKNTIISLDMLFIDNDGNIKKIQENTRPLSEHIYTSDIPVRWVLEVRGGSAKTFNINIGDQINVTKSSILFYSANPITE